MPPANCPLNIPFTPLEKSRLRTRWRHSTIAAVLLGGMVGSTFVGIGWGLYLSQRPPLVYLTTNLLTKEVPATGDLRFLITAASAVDQSCLGSITREFYTPINVTMPNGSQKAVRLKKRNAGAAPIVHKGEADYAVDVPLPDHMYPGEWTFQGETTYDCGLVWGLLNDFPRGLFGSGVIRFRTTEMPFTVVATK